jgi:hypothetical protein
MEYGQTLVPDRRRFRFQLNLSHGNGGTPVITTYLQNNIQNGASWNVNWAQCIDQNVPRGAKFLVTHEFTTNPYNMTNAEDAVYDASSFVVVNGLPAVQTYTNFTEYQVPGSVINVATQCTNCWNAAYSSAVYKTPRNSFVCGHPGSGIGFIQLTFWDIEGNDQAMSSQEPVEVFNGLHTLTFELVSDE